MSNPFFKIPDTKTEPITDDLPGWTKVSGNPAMKTWVQNTTEDGSMISGHWECTPGTYRAVYSNFEFAHIMKGRIVITPDGGSPIEVGPGDGFVVEPTFKGVWEIKEPVRKHFTARVK
jgi:uncharacterized protein